MATNRNDAMNQPARQQTAPEAYAERRGDIARLLDILDMELAKHAEAAKADPKNWGHAGDLGKVRGDLIDMVAFLAGMERESVVEFLDDANAE